MVGRVALGVSNERELCETVDLVAAAHRVPRQLWKDAASAGRAESTIQIERERESSLARAQFVDARARRNSSQTQVERRLLPRGLLTL